MNNHYSRSKVRGFLLSSIYLLSVSCNQSPSLPSANADSRMPAAIGSLMQGLNLAGPTTDVLTNRYNSARTGTNLTETQLHTGNVNSRQFGKLFARPVVGQVYAQPLVVSNLTLADGSVKNVVFVATMRNNVYAFDAEDPSNNTPIWQKSMGPSFPFTDYGNSTDITDHVGVLATPVIDRASNTMYLVATTKENNQYFYKLHALDIRTGAEKPNSPVAITGSVPGNTSDAINGVITFDPRMHLQRPGLLLTQGKIVFAFASHFDALPYHGWVFSYDAATLTQSAVNVTSRISQGAGIWQSGAGLSTDELGNIFGVTGNGFDADATNEFERTESVVKWSLQGLQQKDWFTPSDWQELDERDDDLGCDGAILVPGTNFVLTGAKSGTLYVLDRNNLGKLSPANAGAHQVFQGVYNGNSRHIHGNPIFWEGPQGKRIYIWGENDYLRSFSLRTDGYFTPQAVSQSTMRAVQDSMPGGIVVISANGAQAGTGVLWASLVVDGDANRGDRPGVLRAFDASDLSHELWNSEQIPARDRLGTFAKFNPPTVANGKVYMGTFSNQLVVYGLFPNQAPTDPVIAPTQPAALPPPTGAVIVKAQAGNLCMTAANASSGTRYTLALCTSSAGQSFAFNLAGQIRFAADMCANAFGGAGIDGEIVGNWPCADGLNEKWNLLSSGEIRGINGKCMTMNAATAGSEITIQSCNGSANQKWTTAPLGQTPPPPPPTDPPPPPPTGEWTFCANEGQFCSFSDTRLVRYGAGTTWVTKTVTGGVACTNEVFGDPLVGTVKQCQTMPTPATADWVFCATEGERCTFTGTMEVRYGAGTTWVSKILSNGTECTNSVFGDPLVGVTKQCQIKRVVQSWTFCANEDQPCNFVGTKTVRYGQGSTWVSKTLTGGTPCTNAVFGDPLVGTRKQCETLD